jgi:hypothetical protein
MGNRNFYYSCSRNNCNKIFVKDILYLDFTKVIDKLEVHSNQRLEINRYQAEESYINFNKLKMRYLKIGNNSSKIKEVVE